jgi:hypothetical protein
LATELRGRGEWGGGIQKKAKPNLKVIVRKYKKQKQGKANQYRKMKVVRNK